MFDDSEEYKSELEKEWEDLDYDTRLLCAEYIFAKIVDQALDGGTYRYLIYDRLGFDMDAYCVLLQNGMTISNEFSLTLSANESKKMHNMKKAFYKYANEIPVQNSNGEYNKERFDLFNWYYAFIDLNKELASFEEKKKKWIEEIKERDAKIEELTKLLEGKE